MIYIEMETGSSTRPFFNYYSFSSQPSSSPRSHSRGGTQSPSQGALTSSCQEEKMPIPRFVILMMCDFNSKLYYFLESNYAILWEPAELKQVLLVVFLIGLPLSNNEVICKPILKDSTSYVGAALLPGCPSVTTSLWLLQ